MFTGNLNSPSNGEILVWPLENNPNEVIRSANLTVVSNGGLQNGGPFPDMPLGYKAYEGWSDSNFLKGDIRTNTALASVPNWTMEAWVRTKGLLFSDNIYLSFAANGGTFRFDIGANGSINMQTNGSFLSTGAGLIVANRWTHVAGTWDGVNRRVYVNGVQKAIDATNSTITGAATFMIGADVLIASLYWNGYIKNVRISNIAKTTFLYYN